MRSLLLAMLCAGLLAFGFYIATAIIMAIVAVVFYGSIFILSFLFILAVLRGEK